MKLANVAKYIRGVTFSPGDKVPPSEESVVCMRTKNIQSDLDESDLIAVPPTTVKRKEQFLRSGDILVSSANSWNLVAKCCYVPPLDYRATAGGFIAILRASERVTPRYLYHWLSWDRTQVHARACARQTTNIANLSTERFLDLEIPLPPLEEQRRIAAILDKADAIRRKRQEAIALTEQLLRSTFLEMFGDPVINPKGWPVRPLKNGLVAITPGWSAKGEPRSRNNHEWGVLKVSAVSSGVFRPGEHKAVSQIPASRDLVSPRRGDLLFSRANTREHVAASCLVEQDEPRLFLPDKLWRLTPRCEVMQAEYLRFLLADPKIRGMLSRVATGTSGSMLNVSQEKVTSLEIPYPPKHVQSRFTELVWKVFTSRDNARCSSRKADSLFNALTQQAFTGQL